MEPPPAAAAPPCRSTTTTGTADGGGDRVQHAARQPHARGVLPAVDDGRAALADLADLPRHLRERTRVFKPVSSIDRLSHPATSGSELSPLAVIYWARKVLRGHENPALDVAICAANRLRRPLLVLIEVEDRYPYATARRQHFVLEGVVELQQELTARGIRWSTHVHRKGHRQRPACSLAHRASLVIAEEPFTVPWKRGVGVLASGTFSAPVWLVPLVSGRVRFP